MADVAVTRPDGSTWLVDDTLLTRQLPNEPPDGSFVSVTTLTGTQEWFRSSSTWRPVENAADTHPWSYVCGLDTTGTPRMVFTNDDRDYIKQLIDRIDIDGASVQTVEANTLRCQSNPPATNVTVQFGATTQHLTRRAAVRFAMGLLGAVGALPAG